jgi:hypothetical protein
MELFDITEYFKKDAENSKTKDNKDVIDILREVYKLEVIITEFSKKVNAIEDRRACPICDTALSSNAHHCKRAYVPIFPVEIDWEMVLSMAKDRHIKWLNRQSTGTVTTATAEVHEIA